MTDADGGWITPDDAYEITKAHPKKKISKQAPNIRANMERNNEVLLNGVTPADKITPAK